MGAPKEGIRMPDGRAMIEHVAAAIGPLVRELVVVGACRGFDPGLIGAKSIADNFRGIGPMGGLDALLHSAIGDAYMVVTCDMPFITTEVLRLLMPGRDRSGGVSVACLRTVGGMELAPFPCLLPAGLAQKVRLRIKAADFSAQAMLREAGIHWCEAPQGTERLVKGINTPVELREAIASLAVPDFPIA